MKDEIVDDKTVARPISTHVPVALNRRGFDPFESCPSLPNPTIQQMYGRVLASWTMDLLNRSPRLVWGPSDPLDDYCDRDWRRLYRGDIVDD